MQTIIPNEFTRLDIKNWKHKQAVSDDCKNRISGTNKVVLNPHNNEKMIIISEISQDVSKHLYTEISKMKTWTTSTRASGMVNTSKIFGFQPRNPMHRQDFCTSGVVSKENPELVRLLVRLAEFIDADYKEKNPEQYKKHREKIEDKVLPEWRLGNSIFTSGIINNDNTLTYHLDRGNFPGVWSAMIVLKNNIAGGELCLPEINTALELPDRSLVYFDGQGLIHGVTPFYRLQENSHRYSIVFYSLEGMCKCLPMKEELRRAKIAYTKTPVRT